MSAVVVDANVFKHFYDEAIAEIEGKGAIFMTALLAWGHIAFDDDGKIQNEWRATACGAQDEFFKSWILARIGENKIQLYDNHCGTKEKKDMNSFGVPTKDRKYISLSIAAKAAALFSDDIDLYEPKAKKWPEKAKRKIKENRSGCVCRWLQKKFGVIICRMDDHKIVFGG
jgi:hypothetical protein